MTQHKNKATNLRALTGVEFVFEARVAKLSQAAAAVVALTTIITIIRIVAGGIIAFWNEYKRGLAKIDV